jgi:putative nucleotidyltransferase with HDIG domain
MHVAMGSAAASSTKIAPPRTAELALQSLRPFPTVALRAMNVLSGTDTSLSELCDLVRCDPVFTAEIIRIANSPLIAFSREVTSVMQASMLLGFRRLRKMVITVGLRSYMDKTSGPALRDCWRHSLASAIIAERIARWNAVDRDFAYTAGVLHDIGRVALANIDPAAYAELVQRAATDPRWNALEQEREAFGIDHCAAGHLLATTWKLPEDFLAVTSRHHEPLTHQEDITEVVRCSCLLADAVGFAAAQHPSIRSYADVISELPKSVYKHMPSADELGGEIAKEIGVIEAV